MMPEKPQAKIFVYYYKNGPTLPLDPIYNPIMAGNTLLKEDTTIPGDDSGDNISAKNPYFSELTGIYWAWKNTSQPITGSCHYRRFFTFKPEPTLYKAKRILYFVAGLRKKRHGLIYTGNINLFAKRILNNQELTEIMESFDAILPQARMLKYTVETHFSRYHQISDLKLLENILSEKYPEYVPAFKQVLNGNRLFANNMFVMKDEHYQEFMSWWFDMLFEFERRIDLNHYTDYQKRILGFMAERLLNVWFAHKKLKTIELPVIYFKQFKFN